MSTECLHPKDWLPKTVATPNPHPNLSLYPYLNLNPDGDAVTDGRTDLRTDKRTDKRTDGRGDVLVHFDC